MTSETAVDDDIIESIATEYDMRVDELQGMLVSSSLEEVDSQAQGAVDACYAMQEHRNAIGQQLESAAENDAYKLIDTDGVVFWVDTYDGFGAYIHTSEGETHYVSLSRLRSAFKFEEA